MNLRHFLPIAMATLTGKPRYFPEVQWGKHSITFNVFRIYEQIFGRRYGVRPEISMLAWTDEDGIRHNVHFVHSFESAIVYAEIKLREVIVDFFKGIIQLPSQICIPVFHLQLGNGFTFPIPASPYLFAIAFDSVLSTVDHSASVTSTTDSFTNTAGNVMLNGDENRIGGNTFTSVTYNTVGMTQLKAIDDSTTNFTYVYLLMSPTTGANNLVTNFTGVGDIRVGAVSYSGAATTGQPDASNSLQQTSTSFSNSLTTVADNSWVTLFMWNNNANNVAGSGSTARGTAANPSFFDSNGVVHPAGSYMMAASWGGANTPNVGIMVSIAPPVVATATYFLSLLGAGT